MNRRQLLKASGWSAAGLTVLATSGCSLLPALPSFGASSEADAFSWVKVDADGQVSFLLPRAELGQGIDTGLTLVVAEELQMAPQDIICAYQRTDSMAPCQMTVGSQSIENYLALTALAAASLREVLLTRGAQQLGAPQSQLVCRDGQVIAADGRAVRFAEMLAPGESSVEAARQAAQVELLSMRADTTYIGKRTQALHQHRIVTGSEQYSRDVQVPGMMFGGVAHPPQLTAKRISCNPQAASATPGVIEIVTGPDDAIGIVAETPGALQRGLAALDCQWQPLTSSETTAQETPYDVDQVAQQGLLDHKPIDVGDVATAVEGAVVNLNLRYDTPMAAHAAMEPRAGVARPTDQGLELWVGTQDPWYVRSAVAKALSLNEAKVTVHNLRVGGGFGGRLHCQATFEAAWLAHRSKRPVKVQWSREEEFRYNYVGPQFSTRIRAGLDNDGSISYWDHQMAGAPVLTTSMLVPKGLHWVANLPPDPGTTRGTELPYTIANHRLESADIRIPMPTGPWRGLGAAPNTFAVECAMDELAAAGATDPIALRAQHATDPRLANVLQRLSKLTEGETNLGVAATAYKGVTFVALAAQVGGTPQQPRLTKLWCVHDCGRMIAPDRVRAQIEGNLVWGISMALYEDFYLQNGIANTDNFDRYRIARQPDVPEMVIDMLRSDAAPSGAAEAALAPAAAAIANAFARYTGIRQRRLPLDLRNTGAT